MLTRQLHIETRTGLHAYLHMKITFRTQYKMLLTVRHLSSGGSSSLLFSIV